MGCWGNFFFCARTRKDGLSTNWFLGNVGLGLARHPQYLELSTGKGPLVCVLAPSRKKMIKEMINSMRQKNKRLNAEND